MFFIHLVGMAQHHKHLTENQKISISALSEIKGWNKTQIADRLHVSWKAVNRWINRVHEGCSISEKQHTGRKPLLNNAAKRKAYKLLLKTGCDSATRVAAMLHASGFTKSQVSRTTVIKAAREHAKDAHLARPVSVHTRPKKRLSDAHKQARLEFSKSHLHTNWERTLFTDRSKFVLEKPGVKYHQRIWKAAGSEWSVFTANKPSICYNVYGGVSMHGTTCLIPVTGTTDNHDKLHYHTLLGNPAKSITQDEYRNVLWKLLEKGSKLFKGKPWQLMQDGDKAHKVANDVIKEWNSKKSCKVKLLKKWPANSPDFNIIENVWADVGSRVQEKGCTTCRQFKAAVNKEFENVPISTIHNMFDSIPHRLLECIKKGGRRTSH
jgi:transposase